MSSSIRRQAVTRLALAVAHLFIAVVALALVLGWSDPDNPLLKLLAGLGVLAPVVAWLTHPRTSGTSKRPSVLNRIADDVRPYWVGLVTILLVNLLATPLWLLAPVPIKIAVDSFIGDRPIPRLLDAITPEALERSGVGMLLVVAGFLVLVAVLTELQALGSHVLQTQVGERMTLEFRSRLFSHVQQLSFTFHDTRGTADSIYRIQYDAMAPQYLTVYGALPFIVSGISVVAVVLVTARIDWQLALVALAVAPALLLFTRAYQVRMRQSYLDVKDLEARALGIVQEALTSLRVVKAFGREGGEHERLVAQGKRGLAARVRLSLAEGGFGLLVNLTTTLGTAAVLFIGVREVRSGAITVGELLIVIAYLAQLYAPLKTISRQVAGLQAWLASAERVYDLLDVVPDPQERPDAIALKRTSGEIRFDHVSFAYDGVNSVLLDLSFRIPAGTRLGIVGHTGAGKTTLMNLITRFYDPNQGRVLLDEVDVRDYRVDDLRKQFALVLQEPVLFSSSIAENIRYARPEAKMDEIESAARAANAHGFISRLPDGYESVVGERGMRLSGGERQRISLARAFLRDAPVLILDEPTSSVDQTTESAIVDALERLMEGRTTLMIAHRPSTLDRCEALLKLDHGRLSEISTNGAKSGIRRARTGSKSVRGSTRSNSKGRRKAHATATRS